ncbi:PASTA domain-containing protein [Hymenobacter sp. 5516J-16]|uniref:PASTA domain-containing protein n=1 Tax=Hymenobacter sp. 5516J-16 TaxID=2932253 RepID=UPI00293EFAD9|nr:PASTA domain-containing protein [Hymenobacter sp. 5516J-16]
MRTAPADAEGESLSLKPMAVRPGRVPNVQGLTLRDALFLLENRGLRVRALGTGRVKTQSVAAGTAARRGTTVVLQLEPIGGRLAPPVPAAPPTPGLATLADGRVPKVEATGSTSRNGGKVARPTPATTPAKSAQAKPSRETASSKTTAPQGPAAAGKAKPKAKV